MDSTEDATPLTLYLPVHQGCVWFLEESSISDVTQPSTQGVCPAALHSSSFLPLPIKQMFKMSQNSAACLWHSSFVIICLPSGDDLLQDWRGGEAGELHETKGHLPDGRSQAQQDP